MEDKDNRDGTTEQQREDREMSQRQEDEKEAASYDGRNSRFPKPKRIAFFTEGAHPTEDEQKQIDQMRERIASVPEFVVRSGFHRHGYGDGVTMDTLEDFDECHGAVPDVYKEAMKNKPDYEDEDRDDRFGGDGGDKRDDRDHDAHMGGDGQRPAEGTDPARRRSPAQPTRQR